MSWFQSQLRPAENTAIYLELFSLSLLIFQSFPSQQCFPLSKLGVNTSRKCVRAVMTILNNLVLYHTRASACVCSPGKNLDQQLLPVQIATFLKRLLLPLWGSIRAQDLKWLTTAMTEQVHSEKWWLGQQPVHGELGAGWGTRSSPGPDARSHLHIPVPSLATDSPHNCRSPPLWMGTAVVSWLSLNSYEIW